MSWQVGLYVAAVLLPLAAFVVEALGVRWFGRLNAYLATGAIGLSFVLSLVGFVAYVSSADGVFARDSVTQQGPRDLKPGRAETRTLPRKAPLAWTAKVDWVAIGGDAEAPALSIPIAVRIDNLTAVLFVMITLVATAIHVHSMAYMADDPGRPRYFAFLSLFCFAMLALVASANLFLVFVFWELVGLCSYLLIGFWYEEKANTDAANKAFVVNRIGDVGMLLGMGLLWSSLGTMDIQEINRSIRDENGALNVVEPAGKGGETAVVLRDPNTGQTLNDPTTGRPRRMAMWALVLAGLGVFAGCAGKSAQFPLHVWLPDAMAGPTPVSALIHAATMVAAGVYLTGRFFPLFTDGVLLIIAYTGGITLLLGATIALVQTDYKKVLAYSTVSQLGFMMLGLGVGGWGAGLFHLVTHAFFKALLFLGAGGVYLATGTYEMPALGGLRRTLPVTAATMLIGTLAISGVPFFSGFYSKDAVLAAALYRVFMVPGGQTHVLLVVLPVVGATLTAFYMFRMWFLLFTGTPRGVDEAEAPGHVDPTHAPRDGGRLLTWPLLALAFPAIVVGWPWPWYFGLPVDEPVLEQLLTYGEPLRGYDLGSTHYLALTASLLLALAGVGVGIAYYAPPLPYVFRRRFNPGTAATRFSGLHRFLSHKWYIDELYDAVLVRPMLAVCRGLAWFDRRVIDGLVNGSAALIAGVSRFEGVFDRVAVDRLVNLAARAVYVTGDWSRTLQTGRLRHYLMVLSLGLVGLFAFVFLWVRG